MLIVIRRVQTIAGDAMKNAVLLLVVFLVACSAPQAIVESPAGVVPPETPVTTPSTSAPSVPVTNVTSTPSTYALTCGDSCIDKCSANAPKVCGEGNVEVDYITCVPKCDGFLREQGCKGSCAAENSIECRLIFESQCKRECRDLCPSTT